MQTVLGVHGVVVTYRGEPSPEVIKPFGLDSVQLA